MTGVVKDALVPDAFLRDPAGFGGRPEQGCRRGDLMIRDGSVAMVASEPGASPRLVLPWITEAHCHLDKCHTLNRLGSVGGDLRAAITAQRLDKETWTLRDLQTRVGRGLDEAFASGCRLLRSHVDWSDTGAPPLAWEVIGDLAAARPEMQVQRAALTGCEQLLEMGDSIARFLASDNGVLGLFVLDHAERVAAVRQAFYLAERYGLALDFHVDEGLADGLDGLEIIADTALATGFQGPVLCGHACSMMNRSGEDLARLLDKLARSGISVCALPTTNLYLQGRGSGTPERRGITRLREMAACGIPILVGSDNVSDAFCPTGAHDPMAALHLAIMGAHLDPPLARWLSLVTDNAAQALGMVLAHLEEAPLAAFAMVEGDVSDLISGRAGPLRPLQADAELA